jgi:glycosyltransferase involved in cell wall biosynthesis
MWDRVRGREAFEYPASRTLLDRLPWIPDVVHGHNLHGGYFDLRYLPTLTGTAPVVVTLHDEWLNTGHCGYTLGCERWRVGCGACPDLTIYPAIFRDGTATNSQIKRAVYEAGRFFVAAPSRWLLDRARDGVVAAGALDFRVIPNGVDTTVFQPGVRAEARARLGIGPGAQVLLFAANLTHSNRFKDHATVIAAARRLAETSRADRLILICVGERGPGERWGSGELRQLGYESDPRRLADYYRAADLYLHAAHADNAPVTILEALACGTPVVATATGGIPEQIRSLGGAPGGWDGAVESLESATGMLVHPSDPEAMANAGLALLADPAVLARMSRNAVADVAARFTIERQVDATIAWYRDARRRWEQDRYQVPSRPPQSVK